MMISKGCNIVEVLKSVTFRFKIVRHSMRDDSFLIFTFFYLFFFIFLYICIYIQIEVHNQIQDDHRYRWRSIQLKLSVNAMMKTHESRDLFCCMVQLMRERWQAKISLRVKDVIILLSFSPRVHTLIIHAHTRILSHSLLFPLFFLSVAAAHDRTKYLARSRSRV